MSPFERQIVDAFAATLAGARVRISPEQFSDLAGVLAPQVAAAIEAALPDGSIAVMDGLAERLREKALEALRGGPPAAPPPP